MADQPYDAILFVSFGGPEGPDDVMPFLENVLRGRNVPRERMLEVAEHYQHFDGVSPINAQNRALIDALRAELDQHGPTLPIYWGNRNWHPLLTDTMATMRDDGIQRALAFVTSAFSCYSGCRQYRENIEVARQAVGEDAPTVDKLRVFFNHPKFVHTMVERIREQSSRIPPDKVVRLVFTAHSIPLAMADNSRYVVQLTESSRLVAEAFPAWQWDLVYQSRSGPPTQPWLEPDVCDHIRAVAEKKLADVVVVVPIGFISDHMEVLFDLDTEAQEVGEEVGVTVLRAATAGTHPEFVSMVRDLIAERVEGLDDRPALGDLGPSHDVCPTDCCLSGRPAARPT